MQKSRLHFQLTNPCDENWENMTPNERGRFCQVCEKQVVDFATMSDAEVISFWENPESRKFSCGQFSEKQLTEGIEIPNSFASWKKIASITILGLSLSGLPIELKAQSVIEEIIPAEYQTITRKILIRSDTLVEVDEPAEYATVTKQVCLRCRGGYVDWREIICENEHNSMVDKYEYPLSSIQFALQKKGYYKGKIDDTWGKQTESALISFKKDQHLAENAVIDEDTLKMLGVFSDRHIAIDPNYRH